MTLGKCIYRHFIPTLFVLVLFFFGDFAVFYVLKSGMDRYYGLNKAAEILCVGYSHTVLGIDAARMERELGVPVAKYATAGANTLDRLWMVRQFVERQPSVRVVVYDVAPWLFDSEGLSSASYTLFLPYIDDPAMASYLRDQATRQEYWTSKVIRTARFRDQTLNIALRGLTGKIENKKTTRIRIENYRDRLDQEKNRGIRINPDSRQCFMDTMAFLTEQGIQVILIYIPTIDFLNEIDPEKQAEMVNIFKTLAADQKNICFFDYNKDYQHHHELFYDLRHMNGDGNAVVTGRLIGDIKDCFGF